MPSGFLLSILIHAGAFLAAGMLVVFTVHQKEEKKFVPPKPVERPRMKLKKPKVKVKKSAKPKSTTRIVTKVQKASMPNIQLPEMSGMSEGMVGDIGGFDIMPDISEISVFGSDNSVGSDLEGQVFSLARSRSGGPTSIDVNSFRDVLRKYVLSGWKDSVLSPYYRSPKKLYSSCIMTPPVPTGMAPGIFGVPELEDYFLFIKYTGKLVYPEDIRIRFWGVGDAYIFVNVDGREVLMSAWHFHHPWFAWWTSTAGGDRTHILGNQRMVVGDWIDLKAGEPLDMKVLYGEWKGGSVTGMLLVEVEGVDYPTARTGGPLLPAFKTEKLSWDTVTQISRFLAEGECDLTGGPIFNDYQMSGPESDDVVEPAPPEPEPIEKESEPESALRTWTMAGGRQIEAEFMTVVHPEAVLKTARGKVVKVPLNRFSKEDRRLIALSLPPKLDINFAKTTEHRKFGKTYTGDAPPVRGNFYTFATRIKKTSRRPYHFPLTVEFFAIGDEIGGQKHILLDHQETSMVLNAASDFMGELSGPPVELLDYTINSERRGQTYGGYLVVVKDIEGNVIAYETPSENLYRNYENLKNLRAGWYFDDDCMRCLPTPPQPYEDAANEN